MTLATVKSEVGQVKAVTIPATHKANSTAQSQIWAALRKHQKQDRSLKLKAKPGNLSFPVSSFSRAVLSNVLLDGR